MSDILFDFLRKNIHSVSNRLYGFEAVEKKYERLDYISLPSVKATNLTLVEALKRRKSWRSFSSRTLSLEELAALLSLSLRRDEQNEGARHYSFPSGGNFYPLETYIYAGRVTGLVPGMYHYSSVDHALARISDHVFSSIGEINDLYESELESMPAGLVLMTMVKSRFIRKYGLFGYKLCLIEAGHRGQNICLAASAGAIGVCPLGGGDPDIINSLMKIDGVNEHVIYSMAFGAVNE